MRRGGCPVVARWVPGGPGSPPAACRCLLAVAGPSASGHARPSGHAPMPPPCCRPPAAPPRPSSVPPFHQQELREAHWQVLKQDVEAAAGVSVAWCTPRLARHHQRSSAQAVPALVVLPSSARPPPPPRRLPAHTLAFIDPFMAGRVHSRRASRHPGWRGPGGGGARLPAAAVHRGAALPGQQPPHAGAAQRGAGAAIQPAVHCTRAAAPGGGGEVAYYERWGTVWRGCWPRACGKLAAAWGRLAAAASCCTGALCALLARGWADPLGPPALAGRPAGRGPAQQGAQRDEQHAPVRQGG